VEYELDDGEFTVTAFLLEFISWWNRESLSRSILDYIFEL